MGPSQPETKAVVYGELPGMKEGAEEYLRRIMAKLQGQMGPYEAAAGGEAMANIPVANLARARQMEMLQPGWAEKTSPFVEDLATSMRQEAQQTLGKTQQGLAMQFGAAGHQMSTPYLRAQEEAAANLGRQLGGDISQLKYGDYTRRLGLATGLMPGAISQAGAGATSMRDWQTDLLNQLLRYIQTSKGQMSTYETGGGGGLDMQGIATLALALAKMGAKL